jgi:pimeloyl-ACP methyl ester carboxylesterase
MNTHAQKTIDFLKRALFRTTLFVMVLATAGMIYQTAATESDQRKYPPPGELVNVDGYKMHIYCSGEGSPTIILDHAGGGSSMDWALIQPQLAEHTRVCAYDRAGYGWSDYNPAPRTLKQQVVELQGLLQGAHEQGPFILVGHSYGARVDRVFAANHPDEVAGIVLMDAGLLYDDPRYPAETLAEFESENNMIHTARWLAPLGVVRLLQPLMSNSSFDFPGDAQRTNESFSATSRYWRSLNDQTAALPTVFEEEHQVSSLGDIPLLVLLSSEPNDATHKVWTQANIEMTDLSTHGSYEIVQGATHFSLVYRQDDAKASADGILQVLNTVRKLQASGQTTGVQ